MQSLTGIQVLDLSRLLPGPYATQLLADLGARVIKIERPPEGDYTRTMAPLIELGEGRKEGSVFAQNNVGKASVALNFDDPHGRALLLRLVKHADVFIESFRPGAMAERGLDYTAVRAVNPRIVYCSLSGYGQGGPDAARAGHDLNYLALAGILKLNGVRDGAPVPIPVQVPDLAGGMRAALEIAAALVAREQTGEGRYLDVALLDVAVDWMQTLVGAFVRATGQQPTRGAMPLTGAYPCYNIYETSDGEFMSLGALEPKFWRAFCAAAGRDDLAGQQFQADAIVRVAAVFITRSRADWMEFSRHVDCCLEPLLDVKETMGHAQVVARGAGQRKGRVPRLGEDTVQVLEELGLNTDELRELADAGIILIA